MQNYKILLVYLYILTSPLTCHYGLVTAAGGSGTPSVTGHPCRRLKITFTVVMATSEATVICMYHHVPGTHRCCYWDYINHVITASGGGPVPA